MCVCLLFFACVWTIWDMNQIQPIGYLLAKSGSFEDPNQHEIGENSQQEW